MNISGVCNHWLVAHQVINPIFWAKTRVSECQNSSAAAFPLLLGLRRAEVASFHSPSKFPPYFTIASFLEGGMD